MVQALTAAEFDAFIAEAEVPVLVDLWASWCGPCRMLSPLVDKLAEAYEGRLKVAKVDIDAEGAVAMQFGVTSIPTLLLFKDGKLVDRSVGLVPAQALEAFVKQAM